MENVPRFWPILCSLSKLNTIESSSYLQSYLYLAKEEEEVPIDYDFIKENYTPYSTSIDLDSDKLDKAGFIKYLEEGIFKITKEGRKLLRKLVKDIPDTNIEGLHRILNKYGNYSYTHLEKHLLNLFLEYDNIKYIRRKDKTQMLEDIDDLLNIFRSYEISDNSMLVRGSLDYCSSILKSKELEDKEDLEKDMIITNISSFIDKVTETEISVKKNPELLIYLSLTRINEKFDHIQDLSSDFKLLPRLDDDDSDLNLLLDDENECQFTSLLENPN